jgi:hypothetical protein
MPFGFLSGVGARSRQLQSERDVCFSKLFQHIFLYNIDIPIKQTNGVSYTEFEQFNGEKELNC